MARNSLAVVGHVGPVSHGEKMSPPHAMRWRPWRRSVSRHGSKSSGYSFDGSTKAFPLAPLRTLLARRTTRSRRTSPSWRARASCEPPEKGVRSSIAPISRVCAILSPSLSTIVATAIPNSAISSDSKRAEGRALVEPDHPAIRNRCLRRRLGERIEILSFLGSLPGCRGTCFRKPRRASAVGIALACYRRNAACYRPD